MTENLAPPPPQQTRSGGRLKWVLIGGGGCLVVLFLLLVGFTGCLAALSGGGGEEASPEDDYASAKNKAVAVGETVETGSVAWTVNGVQQSAELKALGESKQGNFVIIDLTFINNGKEAATLDSGSLAILDDQGRKHEVDTDNSLYGLPI
jgi:hypothetical protein